MPIGISSALVLDIECLVYRDYGLAAERQNMKFAWAKFYFGVVSAFLIHGCGSGKNDAAPAIGGGGGASAHGGAVNAGGAPSETPEGGAAGSTAGSAGSNSSAEGGASGADGMGAGWLNSPHAELCLNKTATNLLRILQGPLSFLGNGKRIGIH